MPSLAIGFTSVSNLPTLVLPDDISIEVIPNKERAQLILDCMMNNGNSGEEVSKIIVGLDAEWDFDIINHESSKLAILQIATDNAVYILQIMQMGEVPASLKRMI